MSKILVVVDMQNDFVTGALGSKEAVEILPYVEEKVNSFDGRVIFTRDSHQANYLETQEGRNLPVEHCIMGTEGWQLVEPLNEFRAEHSCMVFDKCTFGSKDLADTLSIINQESPIDSITFIGLCTDICVISNAMVVKAFLPEVELFVDSKCCAGVTPESHENALNAMRACQINIV